MTYYTKTALHHETDSRISSTSIASETADSTVTVDLSVVVNVFREGRLIHPTLRNIAAGVAAVEGAGFTAEVILVLDNTDAATLAYLDATLGSLFPRGGVHQLHVRNGDLGLSRNSGLRYSRGRFVAFSDDDNLYSTNWFLECVRALDNETADLVLHPAITVQFEARDLIWVTMASDDERFDLRSLIEHNYWDAACVAPRRVFEQVPYVASLAGPGFGPEDWHWNCEALVAGWTHRPVPGTAMFYRVKATGSLLATLGNASALLAPTRLFAGVLPPARPPRPARRRRSTSPTTEAGVPWTTPGAPGRSLGLRIIRGFGRMMRPGLVAISRLHPRLRTFGVAVRPALSELLAPPRRGPAPEGGAVAAAPPSDVPDWLVEAWRDVHRFEPSLFPSSDAMAYMLRWDPRPGPYTEVYWALVERLVDSDGRTPDYLFLIPWLAPGGASAVLANYLTAIRAAEPDARIAVLSTLTPTGPTIEPIRDDRVQWISVPESFGWLPEELQARIIGTMIVQFAPGVVHLINSPVGFRAFETFARQLAARSKLFVSLFTLDQTSEGKRAHYILDGIRSYIDHVTVLVDNAPLELWLRDTFGVPQSAFVVHHQPLGDAHVETPAAATSEHEGLTVLWAARLDRQKRPDLLIEIARRSRERGLPISFSASGEAVLDNNPGILDRFADAGITFLGPYRTSVATLPPHDVLLMTSQWEGLPLTLVDAARNHLTLVAPSVGGIPDFVTDGETGFLIDPFDDVEAYLAVLERLASDRDLLTSTREAALALAVKRHGRETFTASLHDVPGYLG